MLYTLNKRNTNKMDRSKLQVGDCIRIRGKFCMVVEVSDKIYIDIIKTKKRTFLMPHDKFELVEWWEFNAVEV